MGGTVPRWKVEPQTKHNCGPWPWLCCPFCSIMLIAWFTSNLSHIVISLRNCFLWLSHRLWKRMPQHNPERHFPSWNYFQSFKRRYCLCKDFFFFPFETFVKIITRKWPVLMFAFWPGGHIGDLVPSWFHFHNVFQRKHVVFFVVFFLFAKSCFWKFHSHFYAFNIKSIMMALRIYLYIEISIFLHSTQHGQLESIHKATCFCWRSRWTNVSEGRKGLWTWTTTPTRRAQQRACWILPYWWLTPLSWRPW